MHSKRVWKKIEGTAAELGDFLVKFGDSAIKSGHLAVGVRSLFLHNVY